MKLIIFLSAISVSSVALAQQAPQAPQDLRGPRKAVVPPPSLREAAQELRDLMRAQTKAIKALSNRVDALEDRLGKIEGEER